MSDVAAPAGESQMRAQLAAFKEAATALLIAGVRALDAEGIAEVCTVASPAMCREVHMPESGLSLIQHLVSLPTSKRRDACLAIVARHCPI